MIFLFNSGRVKAYPIDTDENKIARKFRKYKDELRAVLVENYTRLHSDTYIAVAAEHFRPTIDKPFCINFTMSFLAIDDPVAKDNTFSRDLYIDSPYSLYGAASLLRQIVKGYECADFLGFSRSFVIHQITIMDEKGKKIDSLVDSSAGFGEYEEFLNQNGLYCDSDALLKMPPMSKADKVEQGYYEMGFDRRGNQRRTIYRISERWQYLLLSADQWKATTYYPLDHQLEEIIGFNIGGTGLIYLAPLDLADRLFRIDSLEILYSHCYRPEGTIHLSAEITGTNLPDILNIALYLPQELDAARLLFQEDPLRMDIEAVEDKCFVHKHRADLFHLQEDTGIEFDMFSVLADTLRTTPFHIAVLDELHNEGDDVGWLTEPF